MANAGGRACARIQGSRNYCGYEIIRSMDRRLIFDTKDCLRHRRHHTSHIKAHVLAEMEFASR